MIENIKEVIKNVAPNLYEFYEEDLGELAQQTQLLCDRDKEEAVNAKVNWIVEWLDDIFLCGFYDAEKRDELCRAIWQSLREDR